MSTPSSAPTYSVLGPLQAQRDGVELELGFPQQRAVLAALVVDAGRVVPSELLLQRVWGEGRTGSQASMHACISRLRRVLEPSGGPWQILRTEFPGYRLVAEAHTVDALVFVDALADARRLFDAGSVQLARRRVGAALDLWRGRAYAGIDTEFAAAEARRLEELRLSAIELSARADLQLGRHEPLLEQLPALVRAAPLRESLWSCLMLALYRSGRQAEALAYYAEVQMLLADELGVDPGRELQCLHERMLHQDPTLDRRPAATAWAPRTVHSAAGHGRSSCSIRLARRRLTHTTRPPLRRAAAG